MLPEQSESAQEVRGLPFESRAMFYRRGCHACGRNAWELQAAATGNQCASFSEAFPGGLGGRCSSSQSKICVLSEDRMDGLAMAASASPPARARDS